PRDEVVQERREPVEDREDDARVLGVALVAQPGLEMVEVPAERVPLEVSRPGELVTGSEVRDEDGDDDARDDAETAAPPGPRRRNGGGGDAFDRDGQLRPPRRRSPSARRPGRRRLRRGPPRRRRRG